MPRGFATTMVRAVRVRSAQPAGSWLVAVLVAAGLFGIAPAARANTPMSFRLTTVSGKAGCPKDCADVIAAEGEIDNDTADQFVAFLADHLQDHDLRPVILLESPGGTVVGAMQLGTVFRSIGAAVIVASAQRVGTSEEVRVVPGMCLSACVYAFVGGVRRVVPPISRLGIHRMVINEPVQGSNGTETQQVFGSRDFVASLSAYTRAMGVDPRMIGFAETIAPEQLHIVTPHEIARWKLGRPRL